MSGQQKFSDVPANPDMAKEELALLQAWFGDLRARLELREERLARMARLEGYLMAHEQMSVNPPAEAADRVAEESLQLPLYVSSTVDDD